MLVVNGLCTVQWRTQRHQHACYSAASLCRSSQHVEEPCQLTSVGWLPLPPVLGAAALLQVALKLSALKQQRSALQKEIKWIVKRDI